MAENAHSGKENTRVTPSQPHLYLSNEIISTHQHFVSIVFDIIISCTSV